MARARAFLVVAAAVVAVALAGARSARASRDALPPHMFETVRRHDPQLRRCYARALRAEPALRGKLVVRFLVAATGHTSEVRFAVTPRTLAHPRVEACVARVFRAMRFRRLATPAWFTTPLMFVSA